MGQDTRVRASLMLGLLCVAGIDAHAGEMYVAPAVVYTDDDQYRQTDDMVGGGQINLGWVLSDRVALETMGGYSWLSGADDLKISEASLNLLVSLRPDRLLSPYLIGGVGMTNTDSKVMDPENSALGTIGLGFLIRFGASPVSMRLEHRLRSEFENTITHDDLITSLGLQVAFGRQQVALAAAPVEVDGDADGDDVPDSRDACPDTPVGQSVDARGCPFDDDNDGVANDRDRCPDTFAGAPVDTRGCEIDTDRDGVIDRLDRCPDTRLGSRSDANGCEIRQVISLPGVNFETNSDRLLPGVEQILAYAVATLRRNQDLVVEVAGHTDSAGDAAYNAALSERRAITVRDYLIGRGVNRGNLTVRGYGESQPVADNATPEGKARNRRVELRILNQ